MSLDIPRRQFADLFGPTTGDRIRLADTELFIEIEDDLTAHGDEAKFGGGKVLRDGMGQSSWATSADQVLDTVVTNAVILDHWGIVKADVGIREGRIAAIGKAGNPDIMDGVTPGMTVGAGTEVIAGEGMFLTPGASTPISTSSAPNWPGTPWPRASPPLSAAVPARPRAPRPLPVPRVPGTSTGCWRLPRSSPLI